MGFQVRIARWWDIHLRGRCCSSYLFSRSRLTDILFNNVQLAVSSCSHNSPVELWIRLGQLLFHQSLSTWTGRKPCIVLYAIIVTMYTSQSNLITSEVWPGANTGLIFWFRLVKEMTLIKVKAIDWKALQVAHVLIPLKTGVKKQILLL